MTRDQLRQIIDGITDEQIKSILDINSADIGNAKKPGETAQQQLDDALQRLKSFEGIDVNELQGKVSSLTTDLNTQKANYEKQIADMEFHASLDEAIRAAGGRSVKAVKAELDLEKIRESKNQKEDLETALAKCKEDNGFLFGSDEPLDNPFVGKSGGSGGGASGFDAVRAAMGLPVEK
ncbi:MAG: phage scaffolding protein [Clostridia bacterium]|nr:phage scaffolding protein [Clostridia bacterium]